VPLGKDQLLETTSLEELFSISMQSPSQITLSDMAKLAVGWAIPKIERLKIIVKKKYFIRKFL
jgi:hypothetical protein